MIQCNWLNKTLKGSDYMSHSDYTRNILNIKDKNIIFYENCLEEVKIITMDLYKPYYKLMHSLFRNATLISDRFHIVIQARNALDNTRVKLCNKSNPNYRKLKKYWKLIIKKECELDDKKKKYSKCFRKKMEDYEIVIYLINTNKTLYYDYSNGIVEGMNNLIKQVKHTACGYRKFRHLKTRIMLIKGLLNPIKAT